MNVKANYMFKSIRSSFYKVCTPMESIQLVEMG